MADVRPLQVLTTEKRQGKEALTGGREDNRWRVSRWSPVQGETEKKAAGEGFLWQQTPDERKMVMSKVKVVRERRFTTVVRRKQWGGGRKTVAREEEAAPFRR